MFIFFLPLTKHNFQHEVQNQNATVWRSETGRNSDSWATTLFAVRCPRALGTPVPARACSVRPALRGRARRGPRTGGPVSLGCMADTSVWLLAMPASAVGPGEVGPLVGTCACPSRPGLSRLSSGIWSGRAARESRRSSAQNSDELARWSRGDRRCVGTKSN